VHLHCDNCSGQNKNRYMLWYLIWRCCLGLHHEITLNFLVTGHTKFAPDWCFGLFKHMFRRSSVSCLDDIAAVMRKSTVSTLNVPQLAGKESGERFVPCRNWRWFDHWTTWAGHFDSVSDGCVYVMQWNDNSVLMMATNYLTHEPVPTAVHRVKGNSNITVKQPFIVRQYNASMGGVDLMDRLLSSYRPVIRGKKWWWPLFLNALNVSIVAAWRIHCAVTDAADRLDHLTVRRNLAISLLKAGPGVERRQVGGGHQVDLPPVDRYDGIDHNRIQCSQGRCRVCSKNTTVMCAKCNSDRGKTCFVDYHRMS